MSTERDETIVNEAEELELTEVVEEGDGKGGEKETGKGEGDEEGDDAEGGKRQRSKPAHQRIGELTAARREAERRAEAAEQRLRDLERGKGGEGDDKGGGDGAGAKLEEPNPNDFEFGEADPGYIRAMARYEVKLELAEARKAEQQESQVTEIRQTFADADKSWQEKAAAGPEKYADFNEVVLEGAAAEDWKCGPLATLGIANSDVGVDIAYHLASNPEESEELFALERSPNIGDRMEFMRRFGMLEAQFSGEAGKAKAEGDGKPQPKIATDAPAPPKHTTRGGGGKFEVDDDTEDFGAFEAKVMKGKQ